MWLHAAPAEDMIVVSEIGEQWSPHTAPARHAEILMTSISPASACGNTVQTIGIRIEKVPQLVPVENARKTETRNTIAGRNIWKDEADALITSWT